MPRYFLRVATDGYQRVDDNGDVYLVWKDGRISKCAFTLKDILKENKRNPGSFTEVPLEELVLTDFY